LTDNQIHSNFGIPQLSNAETRILQTICIHT